jgi:hypothetical protein
MKSSFLGDYSLHAHKTLISSGSWLRKNSRLLGATQNLLAFQIVSRW